MCTSLPRKRCRNHADKRMAVAQETYADSLREHGQKLDDDTTLARLHEAAQGLWDSQLEAAAAHLPKGPRPETAEWRVNVAYELLRAHEDQAALMPPRPADDAPESVKKAYWHLAKCRDRLARADAVAAADELAPLNGQRQPGPPIGPRPSAPAAERAVVEAEYAYAHALHPSVDMTVSESWRHLVNSGQMPYDPFSNALHPSTSETAPWLRHSREASALDVPALRRSTGLPDDIYWDGAAKKVVITPDRDGYMDESDREVFTARVEASLWQLGYHTERDGDEITVSKVPDISAWVSKAQSVRPAGVAAKVA